MKSIVCNALSVLASCLLVLALLAPPGLAQTSSDQKLSDQQLEALVAPIALYPDPLLAQVMMASTYPLEVVMADRWSKAHPDVKGAALQSAMQSMQWDESVKSLTAVPETLTMMSENLEWTQNLGDAVLAQQQDVMAAVQRLRARAKSAGNLSSTPQQTVTTTAAGGNQTIIIQPANPEVIYVPVYDPVVVYGGWPYPAYPPYYWYPPGYVFGSLFWWGFGFAVGYAIWGDCDWDHHRFRVNHDHYDRWYHHRYDGNDWHFNPVHRHAVPYRSPELRERYGRGAPPSARDREEFRGRLTPGQQHLGPATRPGERGPSQQGTPPHVQGPGRAGPSVRPEGTPGPGARPPQGNDRTFRGSQPRAFDGVGQGPQIRRESGRGGQSLQWDQGSGHGGGRRR